MIGARQDWSNELHADDSRNQNFKMFMIRQFDTDVYNSTGTHQSKRKFCRYFAPFVSFSAEYLPTFGDSEGKSLWDEVYDQGTL
jgi:hypothetical protein